MVDFNPASLSCAGVKPNSLLKSSRSHGWMSLLLDHHRGLGASDLFETHATPDVTLVVAVRGRHQVEVQSRGHWRSAVYQAGAGGLTPGGETTRLRWRSLPDHGAFETAHIYLPAALFEALAHEYGRAGTRLATRPLSSLIFQDQVVAAAATALVDAVAQGAPELYAEQCARWLATHLLAHQAAWWDPTSDWRKAAPLSDRRLAHVADFMSAHLAEPLGMERLAKEAGISVHHFTRRFREQTGLTPYDYLTKLRMEAAHRLLRTSGLSIAEIAHQTGYGQPAAFSAAFRRRFSETPKAVRRQARQSSTSR